MELCNHTRIVLFSGGMDSTYLAWRLLSDGYEGVHLHHVSIVTSVDNRWIKELESTNNIIKYFNSKNFQFTYSNSRSEFLNQERIGFDSDALLLYAQKLSQNFYSKQIDVLLGWTPYDIQRPDIAERSERNVTGNIWKALVESCGNREYINKKLQFPLIEWGITKDIIIKELPKELLDLTWSCRRNIDTPCGNCHACLEIKLALNNQ